MPKRGERRPKLPVGDMVDRHGMGQLAHRHLEWMRATGYSERTVEGRERHLRSFVAWCEERAISRPRDVTRPILERYQRWLFHSRKADGEPLSFRSQHGRLVAIRAWFRWLARQNLILYNPAADIDLPKVEKRLPKAVLTAAEAERVMAVPNLANLRGVRDRAILEVFYSTGIRRMELANLKVWDLDADRGTLVVRMGKGKKDRMVPIGDRALAWCDRYLSEARPRLAVEPDGGVLFLTAQGEGFTPNRLTQLVRNYVNASGVAKKGACHLFRHTMATLMLEGGADVRFIQEMLGHVKLETTQIYTRVSIRQLKLIHTATHPGASNVPKGHSDGAGDDGAHDVEAVELLARLADEDDDEHDTGIDGGEHGGNDDDGDGEVLALAEPP